MAQGVGVFGIAEEELEPGAEMARQNHGLRHDVPALVGRVDHHQYRGQLVHGRRSFEFA